MYVIVSIILYYANKNDNNQIKIKKKGIIKIQNIKTVVLLLCKDNQTVVPRHWTTCIPHVTKRQTIKINKRTKYKMHINYVTNKYIEITIYK